MNRRLSLNPHEMDLLRLLVLRAFLIAAAWIVVLFLAIR
jgi:hypothetical protein